MSTTKFTTTAGAAKVAAATTSNRNSTAPFDLYLADCQEILPQLAENSVDALVTDPPAGIGMMGVAWDSFKTTGPKGVSRRQNVRGENQAWDWVGSKERSRTADQTGRVQQNQSRAFREYMTPIFEQSLRVLKPGAYGWVWAFPRTSHWTGIALEDAGFQITDCLYHLYAQGWPKSKNLLKPAVECWWLVRKPPSEPTLKANYQRWGVGLLNIEACRVPVGGGGGVGRPLRIPHGKNTGATTNEGKHLYANGAAGCGSHAAGNTQLGRWPANLVISHTPSCVPTGHTRKVRVSSGSVRGTESSIPAKHTYGKFHRKAFQAYGTSGDSTATTATGISLEGDIVDSSSRSTHSHTRYEEVEEWLCVPGCPVAAMGDASRFYQVFSSSYLTDPTLPDLTGYAGDDTDFELGQEAWEEGETLGAALYLPAFLFCPKASPADRTAGGRVENRHLAVKPLELCRWLVRSITPYNGVVLDIFAGSGSIGVGAVLENCGYTGIELHPDHFQVAHQRIALATNLSLPPLITNS